MNFRALYKNAREAVDMALRSLWAADACNPQQEAMGKSIRQLTKTIFAGEDSMPVVQCMNPYESVNSVAASEAEVLVNGLWDKISPQGPKHFTPFEHQYQSWKTLLTEKDAQGRPMSICVTTGTGSGKTECFMLPLVADLTSVPGKETSVKAIFLYPLNALMEDQKERLEQLLDGTDLTYCVYNGDLPEHEPKPDDFSPEADRIRNKISELRGEYKDEEGNIKYRFPKLIYTRDAARACPPDIILTNPTMLEYILLRKKDDALIDPALKSLRWMVIDETHSYTGAGAAEMSMLLRRVSLAFNVNPQEIRYATSSATFGNATTEAERIEAELKLRKFISGITGADIGQVRVIDGKRTGSVPEGEDHARWQMVYDNDFVSLNQLFPEGTVEEKLEALDGMCERLGDKPSMKVKVHYFFRVPNNGLYIKLTEHENGAFHIFTRNGIAEQGEPKVPMLELSRCRTCGEYVAVARVNMKTGEYEAPMADDSDMFDLEEDAPDADVKTVVFGLSHEGGCRGDNNQSFVVDPADPEKLIPSGDGEGWHIVGNTHCSCPYCGCKQTRKVADEKDGDTEVNLDENETKLVKFRTSPDFISRLIAPAILDELDKHQPEDGEIHLHDGQQYLSFADSRQMAAKSTMNQNLAQERMWFYTTVFHELCRRKSQRNNVRDKVAALDARRRRALDNDNMLEYQRIGDEINELLASVKNTLTWKEIADMILKDSLCELFCRQFLRKSQANSEVSVDGSIPELTLKNYVHSIMVMYLAGHPVLAPSPETLGLFHPTYPKLASMALPQAVIDFNSAIDNPDLKISEDDWQNLMRYFIDYAVRNNQAVYLKLDESTPIDIWTTNRFQADKPHRRPLSKPRYSRDKASASRTVRFIADLYARDKGIALNSEAQKQGYDVIAPVIDALWSSLAEGSDAILTHGETWKNEEGKFVKDSYVDEEHSRRLNLTEMSFKLYDEAWLTDANSEKGERHTIAMRPVSYSFKGYAPFLKGGVPYLLDQSLHENWAVYPYFKASGSYVDNEKLAAWAKINRSLLWNNGIWGEEGIFADRLRQIYLQPNLFIQAEHTAQVDKSVARKRQHSFKNHGVNILACSTTMEMGVNLGSLEAVMLSSVPPQPANYKQRSGRSGRNDKVKSVCLTLCGSDAIGLRTYYSPLEQIINRPVEVPSIDLMSPQVIQRHVNSFLVRYFGVFGSGNINQKVANYYTPFVVHSDNGFVQVIDPVSDHEVKPDQKLGDMSATPYNTFNQKCQECETSMPAALDSVLNALLRGTCFEGKHKEVVIAARNANERCYGELSRNASDLQIAYDTPPLIPKYRKLLEYKFAELLNDRLLNFWATHRFTPNANMPVNVLQFNLSASRDNRHIDNSSSNPSYSLREAIGQYVPGNSVVVDGVVYTVRGMECTNMYNRTNTFKQIYRNADRTTIDNPLPDSKRWEVNKRKALELVSPISFLPDVMENTRVVDSNIYTRVSAQLIGANDWSETIEADHLYSVRDNRESGDANILYYNEGKGFGYAYCTCCGRTVIENEAADDSEHPEIPPREMNPIPPKTEGLRPYHHALSGSKVGGICASRKNPAQIRRNIIIGDLVQTDYSEIRIRHKNQAHWISERDAEYELLITLGVTITQSLAEALGKERTAIDFALTPNGHICVFDTNPGGAGYANQLRKTSGLFTDVLARAEKLLLDAKAKKSNDMLLDKYTLRYLRYLDVDAALNWLEEEKSFAKD